MEGVLFIPDNILKYTREEKLKIVKEQVDDGYYTKEESDAKFATKTEVENDISALYGDFYTREQADARFPTETHMNLLLGYKQDTLTAGTNITIDENNVISATGGSGGSQLYVHNIYLESISGSAAAYCTIITNNNTPFTLSTLASYLYNNGLPGVEDNQYGCKAASGQYYDADRNKNFIITAIIGPNTSEVDMIGFQIGTTRNTTNVGASKIVDIVHEL